MTFSKANPHPYVAPPPLPAERGLDIDRAAIIMPIITFFFVAARAYCRVYVVKSLNVADYLAFATFFAIVIYSVLITLATYHGMGLHVWQYTPGLQSQYSMWIGISSEFYALSLMGYKVTLLLLYLQLFGVSRRFSIACYVTMFYVVGYISCNMLTQFLGCTPVRKNWDPTVPGHCINGVAADIAYGVGHMSSDFIIAVLPLPMVWRLQLKTTREKIGVSIVLGSGFIAWGVAVARFAIATTDLLSYDRNYIAGLGFTFSILEVNTGLICACTPTLKPLLRIVKAKSSTLASSLRSTTSSATRKGSIFVFGSRKDSNPGSLPPSRNGSTSEKEKTKEYVIPKKSMTLAHINTTITDSYDDHPLPPLPEYDEQQHERHTSIYSPV